MTQLLSTLEDEQRACGWGILVSVGILGAKLSTLMDCTLGWER